MKSQPKVFRVPLRTPVLRLRCLVTCNPLAKISWKFVPANFSFSSETSLEKNMVPPSDSHLKRENLWIDLVSQAVYSVKTYTSFKDEKSQLVSQDPAYFLLKNPVSKYRIFENRFSNFYIESIIEINVSFTINNVNYRDTFLIKFFLVF